MKVRITESIMYMLVIAFAVLPVIAPLYETGAKVKMTLNDRGNKEQINTSEFKELYKIADNKQKAKLVRSLILDVEASFERYDIVLGPSFSQFSPREREPVDLTIDEKVSILKEYLKNPVESDLRDQVKAIKLLAEYHHINGDLDAASNVLSEEVKGLEVGNHLWREILYQKALIEVQLNRDEEVLTIVSQLQSDTHPLDHYYLEAIKLRSEVLLTQNKKEEALQYLNSDLEKVKAAWETQKQQMKERDHNSGDIKTEHFNPQIRELNNYRDALVKLSQNKSIDLANVTGKVIKSNGEPIANVGVFLREKQHVNHSISMNERYQARTNADGSFTFSNVIPGAYQFNLGFYMDQVEDLVWPIDHDSWVDIRDGQNLQHDFVLQPVVQTVSPVNSEKVTSKNVTFEWEPVEGASYYELMGIIPHESGSSGFVLQNKSKDHKVIISLEDLYAIRTGITSSGDQLKDVHPENVLGFTNPNAKFSWSVKAYNSNGELLTSSDSGYFNANPDRTTFYLKERELTEADELVLQRKYKEAFQAYQNSPSDSHSLHMKIRLLQVFKRFAPDVYDADLYKSYIEKLIERQPNKENTYLYVDYFYDNKQWNQFVEWFRKFKEVSDEQLSAFLQSRYAEGLARLGKYKEAYMILQQSMEEDESHRFVGYLVALEFLLNKDVNKAQQILIKYPDRDGSSPNWQELVNGLTEVSKEELVEAIDSYFSEGKKVVESEEISQFIQALNTVR